jgi:hypothetical protein
MNILNFFQEIVQLNLSRIKQNSYFIQFIILPTLQIQLGGPGAIFFISFLTNVPKLV